MKVIGIIQPGRLGDLIILLPAVKYLSDQGNKIYWPVFSEYVEMFESVIDYVNFIPIDNNIYTCISSAYSELNKIRVDKIIDIAATFPGSIATAEYIDRGDGLKEPFDVFKYDILGVSIEEKWNLNINRNHEAEDVLFNKLVKADKYAVVNLRHSGGMVNANIDQSGGQIITVTDDYNIFHWIKILENASTIAMVDSSMFNLVEQLNIDCKKFLFKKADGRLPSIRNDWVIV